MLTDAVGGLSASLKPLACTAGLGSLGGPRGRLGHRPPAHCLEEETVVQRGAVTPWRPHSTRAVPVHGAQVPGWGGGAWGRGISG